MFFSLTAFSGRSRRPLVSASAGLPGMCPAVAEISTAPGAESGREADETGRFERQFVSLGASGCPNPAEPLPSSFTVGKCLQIFDGSKGTRIQLGAKSLNVARRLLLYSVETQIWGASEERAPIAALGLAIPPFAHFVRGAGPSALCLPPRDGDRTPRTTEPTSQARRGFRIIAIQWGPKKSLSTGRPKRTHRPFFRCPNA
jgi:hypothetical protein